MQSNDAIEAVAPLGGGISEVALFPDAAAVLASTAGGLVEPGRIFHAAGRHLSSLKSDVALFVRRIEIPVIGRDGEIAGVLCRNSPLTSASRSTHARSTHRHYRRGHQSDSARHHKPPCHDRLWAAALGAPDGSRGKATDRRPNATLGKVRGRRRNSGASDAAACIETGRR